MWGKEGMERHLKEISAYVYSSASQEHVEIRSF